MSDTLQQSIESEDIRSVDDGMHVPHEHSEIEYLWNPSWDRINDFTGDGAADLWGKRSRSNVSAIFIHAGAGYHSIANENIHLTACSE